MGADIAGTAAGGSQAEAKTLTPMPWPMHTLLRLNACISSVANTPACAACGDMTGRQDLMSDNGG